MTQTDSAQPLSERGERYRRERHFARSCALQFFYQADVQDDWGNVSRNLSILRRQVQELAEDLPEPGSFQRAWAFAEELVRGVLAERERIDGIIAASATNWTIPRMGVVDRNILRLATFEVCCCTTVPPLTALDEAVELAKAYGHSDSSRFVNGVLDRILREHQRPAPRPPSGA